MKETQKVSSTTRTILRTFGTLGEVATLTYPEGTGGTGGTGTAVVSLSYGYDAGGDVAAINRSINGGAAAALAGYTWHGRRLTQRETYTTGGKTVRQTRALDSSLRLATAITSVVLGVALPNMPSFAGMNRDMWGNPTVVTVSHRPVVSGGSGAEENGAHSYGYDALSRLTEVAYPASAGSPVETWAYDDLGNRGSYTDTHGGAPDYTYGHNVLNQYTSISGQAATIHDLKGNQICDGRGGGYLYDFENRLIRVYNDNNNNGVQSGGAESTCAIYAYDALGRRISANLFSGGAGGNPSVLTRRYYDGARCLAEYPPSGGGGAASRIYYYGPDGLDDVIAVKQGPGGAEHYAVHQDLGSVAGWVDVAGVLSQWVVYDGYGEPRAYATGQEGAPSTPIALTTLQSPHLFTGQRLDVLRGGQLLLYDYKARAYDPLHGRFLQRDPYEFEDSFNFYEYVASAPTALIDPTGEFLGLIGMGLGSSMLQDIYIDYNDDVLDTAISLFDIIGYGLAGTAFEQLLDVGWATDWTEPDDLYRGSAEWSAGIGSWGNGQTPSGASGPAMAGDPPGAPSWTRHLGRGGGPGVYILMNRATGEAYVGRSKNVGRRIAEHMNGLFKGVARADMLISSYSIAGRGARRWGEQLLIEAYRAKGLIKNKINGVAPGNPNAQAYRNAFLDFLKKIK